MMQRKWRHLCIQQHILDWTKNQQRCTRLNIEQWLNHCYISQHPDPTLCSVFAYVRDFNKNKRKFIKLQLNAFLEIGTSNLGLWFKRREDFRLMSFCGADYAGDKVERKSTSGSYHFIDGNLVTWICKKQGSIVLSVTP